MSFEECVDCGAHSPTVLACLPCAALRRERDGDQWFIMLLDRARQQHPGVDFDERQKRRVVKRGKVVHTSWDD